MTRLIKRIAGLGLLLGVCLAVSVSGQDSSRISLPNAVYYYVPASTVFGPEAAWTNPAGIGRYRASAAEFMADYYDKQYLKNWGGIFNFRNLAIAYRSLNGKSEPEYHEYLLAGGVPMGKALAIGGSYRYVKHSAGPYSGQHFWTASVLKQGDSPVSWGAVFSNLNQAELNGHKTEIEQRYSIGYQPIGAKLTVAADMMLSTRTRFKNAGFVYSAEYTPISGLFIGGSIDNHRNFQIGVRVNLNQYFVGSRSSFKKTGGGLGTTTYFGASSLRQPSLLKESPRRLSVGLSGPLPENPPQPLIGRKQLPFSTLLLSLYRAADDPYVKEVVVYMNQPGLGFARAQELRDAFQTIKGRHKLVVCHLSNPGNLAYYAASVADVILVPPVSQLNLVGLRAELTFYAGTMEKLGIKADVLQIGKYKSAAETYTRTASSDENRDQLNRLLDDLYDQFVSGIAVGRGLDVDAVRSLIDRGPFTSEEAGKEKLIDGVCYADRVDSCLGSSPEISLARYLSDTLVNYSWKSVPVLAVVVADGEISGNSASDGLFNDDVGVTPTRMARGYDQAMNDSRVVAVVVRIDSPGGDALASDEIFHCGKISAGRKPLLVSMANTAASGAFYAAMPAQKLFASPGTITGSIGIFGGKPDFSGLYQKIALGKELYTRGRFAGMMTGIRPFSDEERQKYFDQIKAFYDHFVSLVSMNRALSTDSIDVLGRGQVWTGREAKSNGLVDQIGGLKQTLDYAARNFGLKNYTVEVYPKSRPLFLLPGRPSLTNLFGLLSSHSGEATRALAGSAPVILDAGLYARVPFDLIIE